jgi:hypothetical protein
MMDAQRHLHTLAVVRHQSCHVPHVFGDNKCQVHFPIVHSHGELSSERHWLVNRGIFRITPPAVARHYGAHVFLGLAAKAPRPDIKDAQFLCQAILYRPCVVCEVILHDNSLFNNGLLAVFL